MTTKMKNKTLYIAGILALSLQTSTLRAQEVADKSFYSFERIELKTPWLTSENGAGLVFNKVKDFSWHEDAEGIGRAAGDHHRAESAVR